MYHMLPVLTMEAALLLTAVAHVASEAVLTEPFRSDWFGREVVRPQRPTWPKLLELLHHGKPVLLAQAHKEWPLINQSCASYGSRFPDGVMRAEYDDEDERMVRVGDMSWHGKPRVVGTGVGAGIPETDLPSSASYIWHAKHYQSDLDAALKWLP